MNVRFFGVTSPLCPPLKDSPGPATPHLNSLGRVVQALRPRAAGVEGHEVGVPPRADAALEDPDERGAVQRHVHGAEHDERDPPEEQRGDVGMRRAGAVRGHDRGRLEIRAGGGR